MKIPKGSVKLRRCHKPSPSRKTQRVRTNRNKINQLRANGSLSIPPQNPQSNAGC